MNRVVFGFEVLISKFQGRAGRTPARGQTPEAELEVEAR
jgi:hypothetical protein